MSKVLVLLVGFFCLISNVYGQENPLDRANSYYDDNDYTNANEIYLNIIKAGSLNGKTLYRYAYTNEMLEGINKKVLDLYAVAYFYLNIDNSSAQYFEYAKSKLTRNSYNIDSITQGKADEIIEQSIKMNTIPKSPLPIMSIISNSPLQKMSKSLDLAKQSDILLILGIISIFIYAMALLLSSKTGCVIIWGWWDLVLIAIPGLIFVYYLFNLNNTIKYDTLLNIIFFVISIATFALSIIINIKYSGGIGLLYAIVSVMVKIVIMILIPIIIFLFFIASCSGKSDRRYRDGTKGNAKTMWVGVVSAIAFFLIINLIKSEQE